MHANDKELGLPGSFDVIHSRAREAFAKGRSAEAEAFCLQARRVRPDDVGILNLLGQVYLGQGRPGEAGELFSRAIELNPRLPNIHFNLALARQAERRLDLAVLSLQDAIALDASVPILHAKLGQLLSMLNASAEAVVVLRHALRLDPKSVSVRLNLAQALADLGEMAEAEKITRELLFLNPGDAIAHRMLGRIHKINGLFEEAAACFEKAIELQPVQAAAYYALFYSRRITSEDAALMRRMEGLLGEAAMAETDKGLLHYALGKGFDDLGEFDAAMGHFHRANAIAKSVMEVTGGTFDPEREAAKFDQLISYFSAERVGEASLAGVESARPIFIVGMIRSGTTLLEEILSRHPEVCPGGELRYWTQNEAGMLEELLGGVPTGELTSRWRQEYDAELDRISVTARHVTDKMPLNYSALGMILMAYPNAKIIHCRRNPLDTCLSIYVTPFRRGPDFGHDLGAIGFGYAEYLRLMEHWRSVIPTSQFFEVDYEALVEEPETSIRELISFLGLEWDPSCLESSRTVRAVNTPSHWQVRQPIYRRSVGRWRNYAAYLEPLEPYFPTGD